MSALLRVTGTVLSQPEPFRGKSKSTGEPFTIETVKVLVNKSDVTTVNFNRDETARILGTAGLLGFEYEQPVDFLVEVSVYRNEPQVRLVKNWEPSPEELSAILDAHTAHAA